ncbi:hypothetical protein [Streptomyces sp. NPDC048442]|uniref:hypothetical protein n=1 Tax=Streptomyces sp. NPDC048442 TaxID=3154823 RepID=UPI00343A568F
MTPYSRTQTLLSILAVGAGFSTVACIRSDLPWHAGLCTCIGLFLVGAASNNRDAHHLARRRAEAAERVARPRDDGTFIACCLPWAETQSVHAASCPAGRDTAAITLNGACCEMWFTGLGISHTTTCPTQTRKGGQHD